jgi:E3 ubiquitin-protein ligase RNF25
MVTANEAKIEAEVEVVQAVYGDDCVVIDSYPPHLHVHIKPCTADVSSQLSTISAIEHNSRAIKESTMLSVIKHNDRAYSLSAVTESVVNTRE